MQVVIDGRPAGFWVRLLASVIDFSVVTIPVVFSCIGVILLAVWSNNSWVVALAKSVPYSSVVLLVSLYFVYVTLSLSGEKQATVGKRICGIFVAPIDSLDRLPLSQAFYRGMFSTLVFSLVPVTKLVGELVGNITEIYFIGYMLYFGITSLFLSVAIRTDKQGIHDRILKSKVMYGNPQSAVDPAIRSLFYYAWVAVVFLVTWIFVFSLFKKW